jgi:hypothetical protein
MTRTLEASTLWCRTRASWRKKKKKKKKKKTSWRGTGDEAAAWQRISVHYSYFDDGVTNVFKNAMGFFLHHCGASRRKGRESN